MKLQCCLNCRFIPTASITGRCVFCNQKVLEKLLVRRAYKKKYYSEHYKEKLSRLKTAYDKLSYAQKLDIDRWINNYSKII